MKAFLEPFRQLGIYEELEKRLKKNRGLLLLSGCVDSQKVHAASSLWQGYPYRMILTYSEQKAREIYEDCRYFDRETVLYQAKDFLFFHADIQGNLLVQQRVRALQALLEKKEVTIVTTFDGLMDRLRPLEQVKKEILTIGQDSIIELKALTEKLVRLGYERTGQVEAPGQFAVRGGIVDIYALTEDAPWRIELWDDEVDSAALMWRASAPWKMSAKLYFTRRRSRFPEKRRRPSASWIILIPDRPFSSWMNLRGFWKREER